jgi:alkanesulfonate monooxygenase SsuD/methylene tetrahydromethanopterin reductase-like flavin-dependent oxidoreductase (luciferase family)
VRTTAISSAGSNGVDLSDFRKGRLVGTVDEVREQVATWAELGVDTLILGVGAVPFQVSTPDDTELLLEACTSV